jgi:hypothetical protein
MHFTSGKKVAKSGREFAKSDVFADFDNGHKRLLFK